MSDAGLDRRLFLTAGAAFAATAAPTLAQTSSPFNLKGSFQQSGWCVGQATPNTDVKVDGVSRGPTSAKGWFYVGFDRDAPASCTIEIGGKSITQAIAPRVYDTQRVDGLPPETVTPTDPKVLERIKRDIVLKNAAFASRADIDAFKGSFIFPLKTYVVSGHFGNQRILNGVPKSPHMGFDMAAPTGTKIYAPQAGLVVLAEPDLFFEGGLTLIDHGQGLISMYLHQSKLLVKKGDMVRQSQIIGKVGAKGRATGPHLCWRLKWMDRHMDPSLMVLQA